MKYILSLLIAIVSIVSMSAQQLSVMVDGLLYEKIDTGRAKLVKIADYDECREAIINNDSTLFIPDFVCIDNDSLKVAVIAQNSLYYFYEIMNLYLDESISISLPAYLEELGYNSINRIPFIKKPCCQIILPTQYKRRFYF